MNGLLSFLFGLRNDIFKLLPMKEAEIEGSQNHLTEFIDSLIINARGGVITYPELSYKKQYLYVINNLSFLSSNNIDFVQWRKVVLGSTRNIDDLWIEFGGVRDE